MHRIDKNIVSKFFIFYQFHRKLQKDKRMDHLIGLVLIATVTNKKRVVWCPRQKLSKCCFSCLYPFVFWGRKSLLGLHTFWKTHNIYAFVQGLWFRNSHYLEVISIVFIVNSDRVLCIKKLSYICQKLIRWSILCNQLGWLLWMARRKLWMELEIGFWGVMCRCPACGLNPYHINCPLAGKKLKSAMSNLVMHKRNSKLTNMHCICCSGTICFSLNL